MAIDGPVIAPQIIPSGTITTKGQEKTQKTTENGTAIVQSGKTEADSAARATNRGTRIVKKGEEMDKNSFLKILSAELSNQDPTKGKDGTEFVAQLAQFATLEQMTNLNSTVAFSTSSSLVGKMVALSSYDAKGVQYGGTVKAVYKEAGITKLAVQLTDGSMKNFPADTLSDILDVPDYRLDYINGNTGFSSAVSLMGKQVEALAPKDADGKDGKNYTGIVKSVFRDANGVNLTIAWQENGQEITKDINYADIIKVQEQVSNGK
ncbi:flagellar hook capping FlgD N-terminal domain-containing protein [Clostridium sp. FP1]|uniref:flagellar hook capping FlgD N-terminal domain-containing protein n=1 Tax=Clostridium sp. FP1 TaxID=2724076 RepID=UPI0013E910E7|nr:flagellar hook capping FlgD N-terminal domain-containing protein [Clostridium sp. FP1]MBZ9635983.1 flagellar biosynthesis protein FlgD [Clostridium sp. FP1]